MRSVAYRRLDATAGPPGSEALDEVRGHLERGGLLAYPTETVYGFGCALHPVALERLSTLKERGPDRPFLLLVPDRESVRDLRWTPAARELADAFWPGPLTLVLEDSAARYPDGVRGPTGGVAVRRTPHPAADAVVRRLGAPITSTSANRPGEPPARSADEAGEAARRLGAGDDEMWVVDGGRLPHAEPSTIVDCTGAAPKILRPGALPVERLPGIETREP